jgi:hypothetical protein
VRSALVTALASCVDRKKQSQTRDFLGGLSCDELEFIADYLGSCILESAWIAEFQRVWQGCPVVSADQEHKMILLLEFLCRSGMQPRARVNA